ncbi:terminase large subunit [Roseixanthobacter psychrophilus]|uniref:terminase large subunit n=1 Tax=Roseixanthobacter psychrophilus TaxID=3119917 RepID=UPI003D2069BD
MPTQTRPANGISDPALAWLWDASDIADPSGRGDRAVRFLRSLKHPKSRLPTKSFQLDPPFERLVRRIYGPEGLGGQRLVRTVYLQVGKGSRKTSLAAALALLHTYGPERVPRGQNFVVAADKAQARVAFEEAMAIVEEIPQLAGAARPVDSKNRLTHPKSGSFFEALASDGSRAHARTPMFVLVDELWAHRKGDLWQAIRMGASKVPGSLVVIATTAGRGTESPDFSVYEYAKKVQAGEIVDPTFLSVIFEAPRDCDWTDEAVWRSVLPGLDHGYPDLASLRQLAREARERPADREAFQQFFLGIRLDRSTSPFVDMGIYDANTGPVDLSALEGEPCWIGVDMSVTTDLTAVVACWRDGGDGYIVHPWFFCPRDNLRARAERDGVPYPRWAEGGFISATPGNVIDYRAVEALLRSLCDRFSVQEIAFDKAYAQPVMGPLNDDGLPVVTLQLGWVTQSPALNELERAIISRRFRHGGHPVLRWCFENVAIHTDPAGNRTMHKGKSRDRIDGAFAAWMAVSRAAAGEAPSIYESDQWSPELMVM